MCISEVESAEYYSQYTLVEQLDSGNNSMSILLHPPRRIGIHGGGEAIAWPLSMCENHGGSSIWT